MKIVNPSQAITPNPKSIGNLNHLLEVGYPIRLKIETSYVFFDNLYYLIYTYFAGKEKNAATSSAGIIGGLQAGNLLTLLYIILFLINPHFTFNKIYAILIAIFFQITTYIRYIYRNNVSIEMLEEKWQKMDESKKVKWRTITFIYIVGSLIALFGTAIFLGNKT